MRFLRAYVLPLVNPHTWRDATAATSVWSFVVLLTMLVTW